MLAGEEIVTNAGRRMISPTQTQEADVRRLFEGSAQFVRHNLCS
jgi:hypothetical protein